MIKVHVHHPHAEQLTLRGSGSLGNWQNDLKPSESGDDQATFDIDLAPGTSVELKPMLEHTQWKTGPNDVVAANTEEVHLYPTFSRGRGRVETLFPSFYSHALGNSRDIKVYYPPGYGENPEKKYPVIYMFDGQNVFESTGHEMPYSWKAEETLDRLIDEGKMPPAILVAVNHQGVDRVPEFSPTPTPRYPTGGKADTFLRFLTDELKPQVDQNLRTLTGPESTYVIGSSMGGLISLYAALTHPEFTQNVGAVSPTASWDNDWISRQLREGRYSPQALRRLYVDYGDYARDGGRGTDVLIDTLRSRGLRPNEDSFKTFVQPGDLHSEEAWARRLPMILEFLFRKTEQA